MLYAGFFPFLLRTLPQDSLQFITYSQLSYLRERASQRAEEEGRPWNESALATAVADLTLGGAAGGISAFLTTPFDCIKTHINCRAAGAPARGVVTVARDIWRASGPKGFFAGVGPRLMERVPSCAVFWVAAEAMRRVLDSAVPPPPPPEAKHASAA